MVTVTSCSSSRRGSRWSFALEDESTLLRGQVGSRDPVELPIRSQALQHRKHNDYRAVALESNLASKLTLRISTQSVSHYKLPACRTQHRVTAENRSAKNALTALDAIPLAAPGMGKNLEKPCPRNVWTGLTQNNRARRRTLMTLILTS